MCLSGATCFTCRLLSQWTRTNTIQFSAPLVFRPCELLSSLFVRRSSVNISHLNLLFRNHWANCNQTLVEWSLDGSLLKLCPVIKTSNQDGRQAKNRKKGDVILRKNSPLKLLSQSQPNFAEMILGWFPSRMVSAFQTSDQDGRHCRT
jgi:hypothetical protein